MNTQKLIVLLLSLTALSGCFSNKEARISSTEGQLTSVEEKVDALLSYTNKTYDAITDIDLRLETLEQDAKKRGVPTRTKGEDIAAVKAEFMRKQGQVPASHTTQNIAPSPLLNSQNVLPTKNMSTPVQTIHPQNTHPQNTQLGSGHVMAKGLTINTGNNAQSNDLQFPAYTETSPSIQTTPAMQALQDFQATQTNALVGNNALPQQNTIPFNPSQTNPMVGSITGQNLTQQNQYQPQPSPVLQQANTSTKAKKAYIPAPAKVKQRKPTSQNYDSAMNLYKTRKYKQSEEAFDAFLKANPNSVLAPNALYWRGETFYARGNYPRAIFAFKEVQTRYPKHPKAPDALLKTAMSYDKLGDSPNADLHYLVLKEDFPNSSAAKRIPQ